nr:uncharacterized protein LOC129278584 [Lytechinus pictus]
MPGKKKGKGKGKGKKKKSKKPKGMLENPADVVKRLQRVYMAQCQTKNSAVCPGLKKFLKDCYEDNRLSVKFILEPIPDFEDPDLTNVQLDPLILAIRAERFKYIKELHVWDIPLKHADVANLALMMEKGPYPISRLELVDCSIESYAAERLLRNCAGLTNLTTLSLDYNEIGDSGCIGICKGLMKNETMISLSLCYCDLGVQSGTALGQVVSTTAIREVYLNGNNLEAEGVSELIRLAVDHAEAESYQRAQEAIKKADEEALALLAEKERSRVKTAFDDPESKPSSAKSSKGGKKKKKKGKKKKKSKEPPGPPPKGPLIYKLHLADNGIDMYGKGSTYAPIIAMRLFRTLVENSSCLQELDLDDNLIGDLGGREIMEGLRARKEAGLDGVKVSVTHRMNGDTFREIMKLGSGLSKKKKKKGKGKKKVRQFVYVGF